MTARYFTITGLLLALPKLHFTKPYRYISKLDFAHTILYWTQRRRYIVIPICA